MEDTKVLNVSLDLSGIDELVHKYEARIKAIPQALDDTTRENAEEIKATARARAPVKTGALRSSIDTKRLALMAWSIGSDLDYARLRNYVNSLHPTTIGYLTKTHFEQRPKYKKALQDTIVRLWKI